MLMKTTKKTEQDELVQNEVTAKQCKTREEGKAVRVQGRPGTVSQNQPTNQVPNRQNKNGYTINVTTLGKIYSATVNNTGRRYRTINDITKHKMTNTNRVEDNDGHLLIGSSKVGQM